MKLGCCSWSYHRALAARRITFGQWLRLCAQELQVGGVDLIAEQLPRRTRAFYVELKQRCTDLRLTIIVLSPGNNFGRPTAAGRRREIETVRRWIDAAYVLGAPCVRLFAGWPPRGQAAALWSPMVRCFRRVARHAAQVGITLAVEPHNAGGFLSTSAATIRLIRELDSPWVRINLDTGNYHERDCYRGLERSLPYAPHVVAKIHALDQHGEDPTLDYHRIFGMLKRHRYHGFVTVEYEGRADELTAVPRAVAMLRRLACKYNV